MNVLAVVYRQFQMYVRKKVSVISLRPSSHERKFTVEWNSEINHNRRKKSRVITVEL